VDDERLPAVLLHPYNLTHSVRVDPYSVDMFEAARTAPHLQLVRSNPDTPQRTAEDQLHLRQTPRLRKFLAAAAAAGLEPSDAVRLGLQRALVLEDACDAFTIDVESARLELRQAAARTRPLRQLTPSQAVYVRTLSASQAKKPADFGPVVVVSLPDRVTTRVRDRLSELSLHEGVVAEMIAWEVAATLEGRTMCEWALSTLATARRCA
jgi:hypothetical protein